MAPKFGRVLGDIARPSLDIPANDEETANGRSIQIIGFDHVVQIRLQFHDDAMCGLNLVDGQSIREAIDPRSLKAHGSLKGSDVPAAVLKLVKAPSCDGSAAVMTAPRHDSVARRIRRRGKLRCRRSTSLLVEISLSGAKGASWERLPDSQSKTQTKRDLDARAHTASRGCARCVPLDAIFA